MPSVPVPVCANEKPGTAQESEWHLLAPEGGPLPVECLQGLLKSPAALEGGAHSEARPGVGIWAALPLLVTGGD